MTKWINWKTYLGAVALADALLFAWLVAVGITEGTELPANPARDGLAAFLILVGIFAANAIAALRALENEVAP